MENAFKPLARLLSFALVGAALVASPMLAGHSVRAPAGEMVASHDRLLVRYEATALMDSRTPVALAAVAQTR